MEISKATFKTSNSLSILAINIYKHPWTIGSGWKRGSRRNWNIVRNGFQPLPRTYPAPSKQFQVRFPRVQNICVYIYIYINLYICATYIQRVRKLFQLFLTIQHSFCSFIFPCCEFISSCYPLWFYFPASDHPANKEANTLPQCLEICLLIRSDKFLQEVHHQLG